MTKVGVDAYSYELTGHDSQRGVSPKEADYLAQKPTMYDNPIFADDHSSTLNLDHGKVITTKLNNKTAANDDAAIADNLDNNENDHNDNDEDDDEESKNNAGFERLEGEGHKLGLFILSIHKVFIRLISKDKKMFINVVKIICLIGFIIYFGFAMSDTFGTPAFPIRDNVFSGNAGFALFFLVCFAIFIFAWEKFLGKAVERGLSMLGKAIRNNQRLVPILTILKKYSWIFHVLVFVAVVLYIGLTLKRARNLVSVSGMMILILLGTLGSKYPHRIRWQTVFYSFIIQFLLAVFVIRVSVGFQLFTFLGNEVAKFVNYAEAGAEFVFGQTFRDHFYVFKVTSIIIFLGAVIQVLYYMGVMQYIIGKIAWLMQKCLDTTAAESLNAAANIFVGMSEAPLMIMPLVPKMTTSELHAVLVGGFATMAGSILATFLEFGVPANHLIAASVMAAPGALGFSKLLLPETHKSKTSWDTIKNIQVPERHNVIDALMAGAGDSMKICGYLIANLIAFISVLRFLDVSIAWLFDLVHHPEVNFQYLLGLIFYPFSVIVGIPLRDCLVASKLIGIKVSLNEFIAYQELGKIRALRNELIDNGTFSSYLPGGNATLPPGTAMLWDESSLVILTYALCGFANFGSMGIALATLGVFAPTRKRALTKIAFRALIGANMVALMMASIAGLLYDPSVTADGANGTNSTST